MLYLYAGLGIGAVFLGLLGWGTYEKRRADSAVDIANQWKEAATLAQNERDDARKELNKVAQDAQVKYTKDMKGVKDEYDKTIARIRSNARSGMYVNTTCPTSDTKQSGITPNPGGATGPARSELSGPDAEFLITFARDADNEVTQRNYAVWLLTACHKALEAP